ncbi:kinesin-like protein KIN-14R [Lactuca sativa]|uniref:kinesin-like protein KIN-14R n=1 Tax=Lactuca sativa TaxID=4236 RepID=UPI000CD9D010|nr:kinesin-like protein KIN-14R [Lactuca sativa]
MEGATMMSETSNEDEEPQISEYSAQESIAALEVEGNRKRKASSCDFDSQNPFSSQSDYTHEGDKGTPITTDLLQPGGVFDWEKKMSAVSSMDEDDDLSFDHMVCDSSSKLIPNGFMRSDCTDLVMFVNAGAETMIESDSDIKFEADNFFEGGDTFQTNECMTDGGDFLFIYHTARLGNFHYRFNNLPEGYYYIDLHFVEMINTFGPKGMRVFNVFLQDEKVLSDFDIFSVVGANKPLQLVDLRVSVKNNEAIVIRFEGIIGSPLVSGICIRRAPKLQDSDVKHEFLRCQNCATEIEVPSAQKKRMRKESVEQYEKRIQELTSQCQNKSDECYQAWMDLTATNEQLEKVRMELDNKFFESCSFDQTMEKQSEKIKDISSRYEHEKKIWSTAVKELSDKITVLKQDHAKLSREAHECVDSVPDLANMVSAVQALVSMCEDLKVKYSEEQAKRRKLHNQVEDAKGNIRVFCRCRPLNKSEASSGCSTVVDFNTASDGVLGVLTTGSTSTKKTFKFDYVFTPKDNQDDVFAQASPLVTSVLDGYNVCIFAYGQTGTGKTFTMEGTSGNRGVNYRTLAELFKISNERSDTFTYNISVSVLEVYNEQIRDLLAPPSSTSKKLEIKQASEGFHHIPGLIEAKVEDVKEVWNVLQTGSSARVVGSNNVNERSSRSHCMLCIVVRAKNLLNGECTKSKLWLVDLAGSERLGKTDAQGDRLKEAQNINRSLSALGDVVSSLANKTNHIPYRNSKLTHLLQDSLGGDSKTLMFVQISPSEKDLSETLSSLNFATRVRGVELGQARKQIDTSELQKLKTMLDKTKQESQLKDESLRKLEESLQNVETKVRGKDQTYKNQLEKIKELEGKLEMKIGLQSQSEKKVLNLSEKLKAKEESNEVLQQKVKELESKFGEREHSNSITYQHKVRDLEDKLQTQVQESKSYSNTLQEKIDELEKKLKEQKQDSDSILLHHKIKELEEKLKEQDELKNEMEERILKSSNIMNTQKMPSCKRPSLPRRNDFVGDEIKKKRLSRNSDVENIATPSTYGNTEKMGRKSEVPRPPTRMVNKPTTSTRRTLPHGFKEKETKKRMWA